MQRLESYGHFAVAPNKPLVKKDFVIDELSAEEVIVEVAGCGLCHTDISFLSGQVATKQQFPLVLGHEISGRVVQAGEKFEKLMGHQVIIPAVIPCGECDLCQSGRDNICQRQVMPGNDFNGGFAKHIKVPGRYMCQVPDDLGGLKLEELAVIADAVTTPYQSLKRSGVKRGDVAIVIGVGGIGIYMVQHLKNEGAHIIALDIDEKKLQQAKSMGAHDTHLVVRGQSSSEIKKSVRVKIKEKKLKANGWKVFEMSGTAAGQETAFSLLSFAGTVGIVGFTMSKLTLRLSNIMAFDADLFGNWGCSPGHYPDVLKNVLAGRIDIVSTIETHSMDNINEVIQMSNNHKLEKRAIFIPS